MEVSELIATGFTVAMACASLALVAARGRRKPGRARARRQKSPTEARASAAAAAEPQASVATVIDEMQAAFAPAVEIPARDALPAEETWIILKNDQEIGPVKRDEPGELRAARPGLGNRLAQAEQLQSLDARRRGRRITLPAARPPAATSPGMSTLNISRCRPTSGCRRPRSTPRAHRVLRAGPTPPRIGRWR